MLIPRTLEPKRKQLSGLLLVACVFGYSLVFIALGPLLGPSYVVLAVLPVVVVAGLFGMRVAALAGLGGIALTLLFAALISDAFLIWLLAAHWPVFVITLGIAVFVGHLHDLRQDRERELANRWRVETRLETLNHISQAIARGGAPDALGQVVAEKLCELLDSDCVTIFVYDVDYSESVRMLAAYNRTYGRFDAASRPPLEPGQLISAPDGKALGCPFRSREGADGCLDHCGLRVESCISEPLTARAKVVGALAISSVAPDHFKAEQQSIIREVAAQLAVAIDNSQLHAAQQRYVAELEALRAATLQLTASLDREHVLGSILKYALELMQADDAHIFLFDGEGLTFGAALYGGELRESPLYLPRSDGLTMHVALSKQRIIIDDAPTHQFYLESDFKGAIVGTPLLVSGRVEGVMSVAFSAPHRFNAHELRVLELFADHAALAIFNARLVERIQEQNEVLEERVAERTAELQDANRSVEAILDNSSDAILLISAATGGVERMNATAMRWFDLKSDAIQAEWRTFVAEESRESLSATFRRVASTGQPARQELRLRAPNGDYWYADMAMTLDRGDGGPARVICSLRDITLRKQMISTNERLVDGLRAVVAAAYALLSCQTLDELYYQAVATARTGLGLDRCGLFIPRDENFYGTYGTDGDGNQIDESDNTFSITDPLWQPRLEQLRASSSQWITVSQSLVEWRDGASSTFGVDGWVAVTPLRTPQGLVGILFNDSGKTGKPLDPTQQELVYLFSSLLAHILTRKQLEDELRQALRKERELNDLKSRFVSMVSHEFRTPLAIIQSSGDILKYYNDSMTSQQRKEKLESIQEQIRHLTGLLEDILAISRAESVGLEINRIPLDLASLCYAIISEFESTNRHRKLSLKIDGVPRRIPLDPKLMRQAISNLVSNAIKYSPDDTQVELALAYTPYQVIVSVTDHGIGIPANDRGHIFEIFHRAANVENVAGTGLGLAIVKHVVDRHEGRIDCDSEVGVGTTFRLFLPIVS